VLPPVPPVAPDVEALSALERLAASPLLAHGELRAFYIALVEIAKRYLERRLDVPVLEMTSTEMVSLLRDRESTRDFAVAARDLLGAADRVKFACGSAEIVLAERHLAGVRQMIAALEKRLRPVEPETPEKAA
ncbi:MAG: hypothetical protein V1750_01155, partial [Acidobacteriota bacterium]